MLVTGLLTLQTMFVGVGPIGEIIRVPLDAPTIQIAIEKAAPFDTIIVAPGTYSEAVNFGGKVITVQCTSPDVPIATSEDIGGNRWIAGTRVEIGSYEFQDPCEGDDFDGDGTPDVCDGDIDDDGITNVPDVCDFTPAGVPVNADGRTRADLNLDCEVNLHDYAIFQNSMSGGGISTLAVFEDTQTSFSTTEVRDVNNDIVRFDTSVNSIIWAATGTAYHEGLWTVNGVFLAGGGFQVRFGTQGGERRAYFTETANGFICQIQANGANLSISGTTVPVPQE